MTARNVQLKVMGNLALDVKHGYRTSMSKTSHANTTVAVVCNPTSNKGKGAQVGGHVIDLLRGAGRKHGFDVIDVTGTSFDDSLANARRRGDEYDYLVAVGGDGMVALGANAVGCSGKPLGIVAIGSGNDFARGLDLPVNRVETAVEGIVGAIVRGTHIDVDMGLVTSLPDGHAIDSTDGTDVSQSRSPIDRYYAGMLSCGLDASINDRANHSHLPNGSLRYFAAVIVELTHMKSYGYHIKATLADGSVEERDIISPLLTVANSRHIGDRQARRAHRSPSPAISAAASRCPRIHGSRTDCLIWCGLTMCRISGSVWTRWHAPTTADCGAAMLSDGSGCATLKSPAPPKGMSLRC